MSIKEPVIGIDLGTTNSCVAVVLDGRPVVIPNRQGYNVTPSVFAVTPDGKEMVGHLAKRQALTNPKNTVFAVKRLIGRSFESKEVKKTQEIYPYKIVPGPRNTVCVELNGRIYTLEEISAKILLELKMSAEEYLQKPVKKAVITVPAFFNDMQRQATKDAGKIAGLEVLRIINEPTSAAVAYGLGKGEKRKVLVYDLGGGTFDVSILELSGGSFQVLCSCGNTFLGGEDIDRLILEEMIRRIGEELQKDIRNEPVALQRVKSSAEELKISLSFQPTAQVYLPFLTVRENGEPYHFTFSMDRDTLEKKASPFIEKTLELVKKALREVGLKKDQISDLVLVGGQTRMPYIQKVLLEFFGFPPKKGINPDEVVAIGAAMHGSALLGYTTDLLLLDVTPLSLGIRIHGDLFVPIIARNTPVPCKRSHFFTTIKDNQEQVEVEVYQGESQNVKENELLGKFILKGIRPAPRGEPRIEVTFQINAEGLLLVSAKDLDTGKSHEIEITTRHTLTPEEVEKISCEFGRDLLTSPAS